MSGATVGFFGKLPSHGDFLERRVAAAFRDVWDDWMQRCMVESQRELGSRWLDCYLTSPMWRFFLADGIAGAASYAGVLLPSVDRVGRYFPLTVVVELPPETQAVAFALGAAEWFGQVERLCAAALENPDFELAAFDADLALSAQMLSGLDRGQAGQTFPTGASQWRWPSKSVNDFASAVSGPLLAMAQGSLRPMTMWWTDGSALVQPSVLLIRSLPRPDSFGALLAGTWEDGRWAGEVSPEATEFAPVMETLARFDIESAGKTDPGAVRRQNQDALLCSTENRLWVVADGMGGHSHGEVASRMVIDALNALEASASLNACIQDIDTALQRVNHDLRRDALGVGAGECGSTVVALAIRGGEWGVCWAGDSRAYLFRDGNLLQLTYDHKLAGDVPDAITRAVGGDDVLELDQVADRVQPNDRFLLCSDGLYGALDDLALIAGLQTASAQDASVALIDAALTAGARDNITAVVIDVKA